MSLEDLLAEEPAVQLQRQSQPGQTDKNGVPLHGLVNVKTVIGRVIRNSAQQQAWWRATLGVECSYEFLTMDGTLKNGDFISTSDSRLFRLVGVANTVYAKGGIPQHTKYPMSESRLV